MIPGPFGGIHAASVEDIGAPGVYGRTYGTPRIVACFAEQTRKMVRTSSGDEVVSEVTLFCDPDVSIAEGSRVTVNGRTSFVISTSVWDTTGILPLDHVEVALS